MLNINVGASPYAIICRPYGTYLLQSFYRTPIISNSGNFAVRAIRCNFAVVFAASASVLQLFCETGIVAVSVGAM